MRDEPVRTQAAESELSQRAGGFRAETLAPGISVEAKRMVPAGAVTVLQPAAAELRARKSRVSSGVLRPKLVKRVTSESDAYSCTAAKSAGVRSRSISRSVSIMAAALNQRSHLFTNSGMFGSTSTAACSNTINNRLRVRAHSVPNSSATGESTPIVKAMTCMGSEE